MNDNKIIITEDGEKINLTELDYRFGSYELDGKTYYASRQMERTNRVFPGWFGDASEGNEYADEWSAPGYDEQGNKVEIYMVFTQIKGEEMEDDNLDWTKDASRVEFR